MASFWVKGFGEMAMALGGSRVFEMNIKTKININVNQDGR
jgi:hypothetical protein